MLHKWSQNSLQSKIQNLSTICTNLNTIKSNNEKVHLNFGFFHLWFQIILQRSCLFLCQEVWIAKQSLRLTEIYRAPNSYANTAANSKASKYLSDLQRKWVLHSNHSIFCNNHSIAAALHSFFLYPNREKFFFSFSWFVSRKRAPGERNSWKIPYSFDHLLEV